MRATQSGYRRRATLHIVCDGPDGARVSRGVRVAGEMRSRRRALVLIAVVFAATDLTHKLVAHAEYHHVRSPYVAFGMSAVIVGLVAFVPRVPSRVALVGAAVAVGGALGNLLSLLIWSGGGVPDPLVVQGATSGVAFNLADVFALAGDAVMVAAVMVHGARHRATLGQQA
jgi:hypothetical protein